MKLNLTSASLIAVILWTTSSFAAQTQPRYPVDPQSKWAIGTQGTQKKVIYAPVNNSRQFVQ